MSFRRNPIIFGLGAILFGAITLMRSQDAGQSTDGQHVSPSTVLQGPTERRFPNPRSTQIPGFPNQNPYIDQQRPHRQTTPVPQNATTSASALSTSSVTTNATFLTAASYASGGPSPVAVTVRDFNGDGKADLAVANQCSDSTCASGSVSVLLGNGDGTFQPAQTYATGGRQAFSVTAGDFNRDGKVDLAVTNECSDATCATGSVSVFLGNGDGTFQAAQTYASGGEKALSVTVGDFNGDGKADLAVTNQCLAGDCTTGSVSLFFGNGDGTFQAAQSYASGGQFALSVAVGDFNADGKVDLAVTNECSDATCATGSVTVFLGNGDGTFQVPQTYASGGQFPFSVMVGDFNGDGKADLAVANNYSDSTQTSGGVSVLLGNGDGTFQVARAYVSGGVQTFSVTVGDFNGDGNVDLAVANYCTDSNCKSGSLSVFFGNGDGTFQAAQTYAPGGHFTSSVTVGDFNGDGRIDLVATSGCVDNACSTGNVNVLFGNGDGTFQAARTYTSGGQQSFSSAVADFNGDGKVDLAVANQCLDSVCATGSVSVFLGNGDGTFQATQRYSSGGQNAQSVIAGDFNGDGKADLAVANNCSDTTCSSSSVSVLLGNGDGTFQPAQTYSTGGRYTGPQSVALGDFNGDGKSDLVVVNECSSSTACANGGVSVLLGNGDGTFQPAQIYASGGRTGISATVRDFNGDGKADLAVANDCSDSTCTSGSVGVLLGNGDGTFQAAQTYASGGQFSFSVTAGDFNGDGKADLAVANQCSDSRCTTGNVSVLLGAGDGTFRAAQSYASGGPGAASVTVGDFNSDGIPDLFVSNPYTSGLLFGNGDGTFQAASTYSVGGEWFTTTADFNGDGKPDIALIGGGDVTILLNIHSNVRITASTTTLASSSNPSTYAQLVTLTATVTIAGAGAPTGTVTFQDGASTLGTGTVSGGIATLPTSSLGIGAHSITASYSGDANFSSSTSAVLTQNVNQAGSAISLASSANPAAYNQSITFTTMVTAQNGGPATGTVTFKDGSASLGSAAVNGNTASLTLNSLSIGSHSITVVYSGDGNVTGSSSAALTQSVNKAATTAVVVSSANPSSIGTSVTFTLTVFPQFAGNPTGTVVLKNGSSVLATLALNAGQATYTKTFSGGTFSITAVYGGDVHFTSSTSTVLKQVVNKIATSTAVTSSSNPTNVGQAVTFTATVSSTAGAPPDGEVVTFRDGSTTLGTGSLAGGTATFTTSSLAAGTRSITATYSGDTKFAPSTSPKFSETVNRYSTTATVTSGGSPSTFGQSVTITSTVTSSSPGQAISGTVTFKSGGTALATQTFTGTNTLTISTLPVGTHAITVVYNGDATNAPSTSPAISQVVTKAATSTNLVSSLNPSTAGQAVTFTATVASFTTGTPTGTVTFKSGTAVLGTVSLSSGSGSASASLTTSSLASGSHSITATYNANSNFTSSSTTLTQVVN